MNKIPEDSMLRRHYLTEQKYKQGKVNSLTVDSVNDILPTPEEQTAAPFWSNQVLIPLVMFAFFMAIIFI